MAPDLVTGSIEQCCIIQFLEKGEVKPAEILHRLNTQCGVETLSCQVTMIATESFLKAIKKSLTYFMLTFNQQTVTDVNIHHIKELILGNRRITVCDIASNSSISFGSVETIIHE
jgi:hypothetical protein